MSEEKKEILVVASKVKNYIKTVGDMKCSSKFIELLSDKIREICEEAVQNAKSDRRKTVLDKDL